MTEPWLSKREFARKLGCSVRTVERHYTPWQKVGNQNRYLLSQAENPSPRDLPDNVVPLRPRRRRIAA